MKFRALDIVSDWYWVRSHVECVMCADTKGIVATDEAGFILGAVIADSWSHNCVQAHLAATTPMVWKHGLHKEFFKWIFTETGREQIIGFTPANNKRAVKFNRHMGFTETYRLPDGYDKGVDYIMFRMLKSECKYLEQEDANTANQRAA